MRAGQTDRQTDRMSLKFTSCIHKPALNLRGENRVKVFEDMFVFLSEEVI